MLENLKKKAKGDEERMQMYAREYVISMSGRLRSLKEALELEKYHDVGTIIHKAKSLFNVVGLDEQHRLATHIEMGINKRYSQEMTKEHTLDLIKDIEQSIKEYEPYVKGY
jgi:HPt (histidine-containing phosphotransfer) domain-containing protein